ncbi:hypothetical protein FNF27_01334 [Cafeteria roenbergensis]|uniref:EF-hand domain-containing protein n=1 Tax=Cafeteria roenbergensis TaxID=33653 RepID=A0A5A8DES8_CAFRO|nr:hypothetical protein FNF31_02562 [Cafeteria roenbergensis]KAA0177004.1 hypothetical protein FNF27_01334 [Cafeteria roenbergensis]
MGSCCSATQPVPARYYESTEFQRAADLMYLNDADLRVLWTGFSKLLLNPKDKVARVLDLLRRLNVPPTAMSQRSFEITDVRGISQVSFKDFVVCYWNLCTLERPALIAFVYDVLVAENSGDQIELSALRGLIEEVLGSTLSARSRRYIDEATARAPSSRLLPRQFFFLADKDSSMLQPAFWLQRNLQVKIGGKYFWRMATERRRMFSNAQSWRDLVKQLNPGTKAHPDSLPAATRTLPGAGVDGAGGKGRVPSGMARIAQRAEDHMGGAAAPKGVGVGKRDTRGARRSSVAGGAATARGGGSTARPSGRGGSSTARSGKGDGEEDDGGDGAGPSGQPSATEARELIKRATVSDYFTSGRKRQTADARQMANMAQPVPAAATPYVFPQMIRVLGGGAAGGQEGGGAGASWPTNPNAALGMAMGLDPAFAVALTKASRVKGYYRRARKPNLPQYVLHTSAGTASAQFSLPGVQDGVRGRWRHMRRKATLEDKRAGFAIARGGGFFSGIGLNQNKSLDGVFDAEIIRIRPKPQAAEKRKGTSAVTGTDAEPQTARGSAKGVAAASQRPGQAPAYTLEGYATVAAKQREVERTMAQLEEEQLRRQEETAKLVADIEAAERVEESAKAAAAQSRLKGTPGREPSAKKRPALATPGAAPAITPSGLDTIGGLATTASKRRLEQSSGSKSRRGLDRRDPAVRPLLPVFDVGVGGHVDNSGGAGGDFSGGAGGDC